MNALPARPPPHSFHASRPAVRHIRYWAPGNGLTVSDTRVLAGGYVHPRNGRALIAVLNPTESPIRASVTLAPHLLAPDKTVLTDVLTGKPITRGNRAEVDLAPHGTVFLLGLQGSGETGDSPAAKRKGR